MAEILHIAITWKHIYSNIYHIISLCVVYLYLRYKTFRFLQQTCFQFVCKITKYLFSMMGQNEPL